MKWILILIPIHCLSSYAYSQDMRYTVAQNVPLLTQKNELRLSASTGTENYGFQAAYSFSKSFAVTGSFSFGSTFDNSNRNSWEFAVGYFKKFKDSIIIEIFGGAGRYHRDFQVWNDALAGSLPSDTFRTNCTEPFVQFDLGIPGNRRHSFSISARYGYLFYDHFYSFHAGVNPNAPYGPLYSITNHANSEPSTAICLTYRLGGKKLSFQAQAGMSAAAPVSYYDTGGGFFLNVGLSLRLFGEKEK